MPQLIQDWVTQQASRNPHRLAIAWKSTRVTYEELERRTNQLAELLRESGCHAGDRVAFCLPKSPAAIISMIGTLKADCVYVPIDPDCPAARIGKVIDACRPKWLLIGKSAAELVDQLCADKTLMAGVRIGSMDDQDLAGQNFSSQFSFRDLDTFSDRSHAYQHRPSDPAHILFTSGSTGVPKGVVIKHENVIAFVNWAVEYFQMTSHDRVSGHAPLHFDLSTFDTFGAFAAGAELFPVPPELNLLPNKLADFIRHNELTQWFSVPSILNYLAKFDSVRFGDFPALKRLMWCGEVLPTPTLIYLMQRLPAVQFTNLYGPTEATIASSYFSVPHCPPSETQSIPIGQPCDGEQLFVLNDKLQSVPTGEAGDLYIGGIGLSPGYWRDPAKTDAVFVRHPETGERIYKTGDLARVGDDGLVYFIGRADTQIKSRGYRIELGEIEAGLSALTCIDESAVVAIDTEGFENKLICCAYVAKPDQDVPVRRIRTELATHVPKYMVPSLWLEMERLPKNGNGKIDRPRLRQLFTEQHQSQSAPALAGSP